jgi:hypothetical protein
VTHRLGRRRERVVVPEDCPLELLQRLARLEAQLGREQAAALAVDVERLGLATGSVEREHELAAEPLLKRVLADERAQLADELRVPAQCQVGVDPVGERTEAELVEADALQLNRLDRIEICQRLAPP